MKDKMTPKWYENEPDEMPIKKKGKPAGPDDGMEEPAMHGEMMHHHHHMPMIMAHSYVPWQVYTQAFCPQEALAKGTLFPELWGVYPIPE